mmetsp:Transcript_5621/g.8938  ORF Transcript_5621/g.8938 Transcript_5621/m.8938 type:complete len:95 (-) Transcript_5621:422-706(-)
MTETMLALVKGPLPLSPSPWLFYQPNSSVPRPYIHLDSNNLPTIFGSGFSSSDSNLLGPSPLRACSLRILQYLNTLAPFKSWFREQELVLSSQG